MKLFIENNRQRFCTILNFISTKINDSTCKTRKNVFYFTSKVPFVLEEIKV